MSKIKRASGRKYHIIYKTTCTITGKWYIGMHSTDNIQDGYLGSGMHLWRSIDKYGRENHSVEILEYLPDRKSLSNREKEILLEVKTHPLCMNIAWGGEGYYDRPRATEETRKKLSDASKQYNRTPEWYDKIVASRRANDTLKHTEETKLKISKSQKGKKLTEEHKREISDGLKGRIHSEETKMLISKARKGKPCKRGPVSDAFREAIRKSRIGKRHSEQAKLSMRKPKDMSRNKKPCTVDGINVYASVGDLVKALGSGVKGSRSPNFRYV